MISEIILQIQSLKNPSDVDLCRLNVLQIALLAMPCTSIECAKNKLNILTELACSTCEADDLDSATRAIVSWCLADLAAFTAH